MATYLVVLMQFKLTLLRQAAKANLLNAFKAANDSLAYRRHHHH